MDQQGGARPVSRIHLELAASSNWLVAGGADSHHKYVMLDWLTIIPVAVLAAMIGAGVSYANASKSVYISSITAERSKWIDKLRNNLAAFSSTVAQVRLRVTPGVPDQAVLVRETLERQNDLAALIQLQLNPRGAIDENILKIVETICIRTDTPVELIQRADDALISHSQWLLKAEWEKVKFEARGPIYRFLHRTDEAQLIRDYDLWCHHGPSLDLLIADFDKERAKP